MARKLVLKENGLNGSGNSPSGYKYLGDSSGDISQKVGATVSSIGGSTKPYTEMVGLFSQSATNAPTVIILENDIPGTTLSGSYLGPGIYRVSFGDNSIFDNPNKVFIQLETRTSNGLFYYTSAGPSGITISAKDYTGSFSNIGMTNGVFIVRIYN